MTIADMKDRILRPHQPHSLNAKKTTDPTETSVDGSRGQAYGALESGPVAHQTGPPQRSSIAASIPSLQALFGGTTPLRVPKPSEIFGIQPGLHHPYTHSPLQRVSNQSGVSPIPQLPTQGQLTGPSVTRQREHERRLRSMATKMQRANQKRRMEANLLPPEDPIHPDFLAVTPSATSPWGGLFTGIRQWCAQGSTPHSEQDVGVHLEFDTDIVDALVYTIGRWMGLDAEQLRHSPGLRTLVSRNIEWFRSSPDWLKLAGLILAKKLNRSLDCPSRSPSDTQRMLLDRMMMGQTTSEVSTTTTTNTETPAASEEEAPAPAPTAVEAIEAPPTKKRRINHPKAKASADVAAPPPEKKQKSKPPRAAKPKKSKIPVEPETMDPNESPVPAVVTKTHRPPRIAKKRSVSKLQDLLSDSPLDGVFVDTTSMDVFRPTDRLLDEKTQATVSSDPID